MWNNSDNLNNARPKTLAVFSYSLPYLYLVVTDGWKLHDEIIIHIQEYWYQNFCQYFKQLFSGDLYSVVCLLAGIAHGVCGVAVGNKDNIQDSERTTQQDCA